MPPEKSSLLNRKQLDTSTNSCAAGIADAPIDVHSRNELVILKSCLSAVSEMISVVAHQWRQPLNTLGLIIQGLHVAYKADLLTGQELEEDVDESIQALQKIAKSIDDFRALFSHDDAPGTVSINDLVLRAIDFITPALMSKGIAVRLEEVKQVTATVYPAAYVQALLAITLSVRDFLITHAVPDPLISIRVSEENNHSVVTVHDNGGGLGDDVLPRIFAPGFSAACRGSGAGPGLYAARLMIENFMSGRVSVCNAAGGAEYRVEV